MGRIYSHSSLEAAVCEARFADSMKVRYGKAGPALQGTAFHRWIESYLRHLWRNKVDSDVETGRAMWAALRAQMPAEDEKGLEHCMATATEKNFGWLLSSEREPGIERVRFWALDGREVAPENVAQLTAPVFRTTEDLTWRGPGSPILVDPLDSEGEPVLENLLDWKTHRVSTHVKTPSTNRQLRRYAAPRAMQLGEPMRMWLGFPRRWYFEHDIITPEEARQAWHDLVVVPIMRLEELYEKRHSFEGRTVFAGCKDCDLRRACDAAIRYPEEIVAFANATPQQKALALSLAKRLAADLSKEVKASLADATEPLDVDDYIEVDIDETEVRTYPRPLVERVLRDFLPPALLENAFTASRTRLDRVMKDAKLKPDARAKLFEKLDADDMTEVLVRSVLKVRTKKHEREAPAAAPVDEVG